MYNIVINHRVVLRTYRTLKEARAELSRLRKVYAKDLPKGKKCLARFEGKDRVVVHKRMDDGRICCDEITFTILEA